MIYCIIKMRSNKGAFSNFARFRPILEGPPYFGGDQFGLLMNPPILLVGDYRHAQAPATCLRPTIDAAVGRVWSPSNVDRPRARFNSGL